MTATAMRPIKPESEARARRRAAAARATFQEPLIPDRTDFNGIPIVREEPVRTPLKNGSVFKTFCKLILADGSTAYACNSCRFMGETRGTVLAHRNAEHGAKFGKKAPKVEFPEDRNLGDLVLKPRKDGTPAPSNPLQWTLGELLALVPSITALGDLVSQAEADKEAAETELSRRAAHDRENAAKLANYDALQEELVDRRMAMKGSGTYEELKAEVIELRKWKKEMIKKLTPLGFAFQEEEKDAA